MKPLNRFLAVTLVIVLIALSGKQGVQSQQIPGDVPTGQGGYGRTGEVSGPGPSPDQSIVERWRLSTGPGSEAAPAIVNNMLYVGGTNGILHAIDLVTLEGEWSFEAGSDISSTPTVESGVVLFGAGQMFYALDAMTGDKLWERQLSGNIVNSSAAVLDGVVYVGAGKFPTARYAPPSSEFGKAYLYGLDLRDGKVIHELPLQTDDGIRHVPYSSPAIVNRQVVIGSAYGPLVVFTPELDRLSIWLNYSERTFLTDLSVNRASTPITINNEVAYISGDALHRHDTASVGLLRSWNLMEYSSATNSGPIYDVAASPAYSDGFVYVPLKGRILAFGWEGQDAWSFEAPDGGTFFTAAIAQGILYAGTDTGTLVALDAQTGAERWSYEVGGKIKAPPVVNGHAVWVTTTAGYLVALTNEGSVPLGSETGGMAPAGDTPPLGPSDICVTPTPNNDPAPGESAPPMPCPTSPAGAPSGPSSPGDLPPLGPDDICMTPAPNGNLPPGESAPPMPCPTEMTG